MRFIYETGKDSPLDNSLKNLVEEHPDITLQDATAWDEDQRMQTYLRDILPLSITNRKRLRGRIRTHQAGHIQFNKGVLLTDSDFFIGDEIIEFLEGGPNDE